MRKILFRGKRLDNGEWIQGFLVIWGNDYYIAPDINAYTSMGGRGKGRCIMFGHYYQVLPETVGQFTGLTDKNGKKIFEGDIVKVTGLFPDRDGEQRIWRQFRVGEVFYYHGAFFFGKWGLQKTSEKCIEIIGNIYDNPELLEVEK